MLLNSLRLSALCVVCVFSLFSSIQPAKADAALDLYQEWAVIKYGGLTDDQKLAALIGIESQLEILIKENPRNAEAKIILGTVKSTHAALIGGISALPHVKGAKKLLEAAIKIDDKAMDGEAHAILGALYLAVPGWPIGFGDDDKSMMHIKRALNIAPNSIDAYCFLGDYWFEHNKFERAKVAYDKAILITPRSVEPAYNAADLGRQAEVKAKLALLAQKTVGEQVRGSSTQQAQSLND
jgi:tetratricopeptide (TPR) repeat protein